MHTCKLEKSSTKFMIYMRYRFHMVKVSRSRVTTLQMFQMFSKLAKEIVCSNPDNVVDLIVDKENKFISFFFLFFSLSKGLH